MLNNLCAVLGFPPSGLTVTGGTLFTSGGYNYRLFTGNGTLTVTGGSITGDVLLVAGGAGGGGSGAAAGRGGGGGAGGVRIHSSQSLSGSYVVTVGAGGTAGITDNTSTTGNQTDGGAGIDSSFGGLGAATGGGFGAGGAKASGSAGTGGSGGGSTGTTSAGAGTAGQGNNGGTGAGSFGAGGGGAGAAGGSATFPSNSPLPNGGNGVSTYSAYGLATSTGENISGTVWYGGGGTGVNGSGGNGGGGDNRQNGTANTGGGGGGCESLQVLGENGGAGGSGVVIVRYPV